MKAQARTHTYSPRRIRRYAYPNEADRGYFAGKLLDGITAGVIVMGTVTTFLYLVTI